MAGSDGERLLTPAEAAGMLRVDPSTVSRWHRQGLIPGLRTPGGHRRFRESDVRALMQPSPSNA
jgi:excisionase family DNA binding protein